MKIPFYCAVFLASCGMLAAGSASANSISIDNDVTAGTVGSWQVDVQNGGQSRSAILTASPLTGGTATDNVLYDYFTYVDTGTSQFQLPLSVSGSVASTGDDTAQSSGSFAGSNGNTVNWTATSSIAHNSPILTNTYQLSVDTGTLGELRLFQYLDEDVLGISDDVFLTRGSSSTNDLQLYTVDNSDVVGVSQSGAFTTGQGLANASFAGWAACAYNNMKPAISAGTQSVSPSGVIGCGLASFNHPQLGTVYGEADIVSALAWDALASASRATIVTTLGGVPDISVITPPTTPPSVPAPASLGLLGLGLVLLGWKANRGRPSSSA